MRAVQISSNGKPKQLIDRAARTEPGVAKSAARTGTSGLPTANIESEASQQPSACNGAALPKETKSKAITEKSRQHLLNNVIVESKRPECVDVTKPRCKGSGTDSRASKVILAEMDVNESLHKSPFKNKAGSVSWRLGAGTAESDQERLLASAGISKTESSRTREDSSGLVRLDAGGRTSRCCMLLTAAGLPDPPSPGTSDERPTRDSPSKGGIKPSCSKLLKKSGASDLAGCRAEGNKPDRARLRSVGDAPQLPQSSGNAEKPGLVVLTSTSNGSKLTELCANIGGLRLAKSAASAKASEQPVPDAVGGEPMRECDRSGGVSPKLMLLQTDNSELKQAIFLTDSSPPAMARSTGGVKRPIRTIPKTAGEASGQEDDRGEAGKPDREDLVANAAGPMHARAFTGGGLSGSRKSGNNMALPAQHQLRSKSSTPKSARSHADNGIARRE